MATREPISGAIQHNPMAVGPRRYGANASFTATSGTLPKTGYRQRSRNQMQRDAIQQRLDAMNRRTS